MASILWALLTDPTTIALLTIAICTAAYASYRADESLIKQLNPTGHHRPQSVSDLLIDEQASTLQGSIAILFPVIAAASMVFLFFFLKSIGVILTLLSAISAFFSLLFLIWPVADFIASKLRHTLFTAHASHYLHNLIAVPIVSLTILIWLFTGHWLVNDIIAISLCILFASLCKVPSLKVTSILFAGLFVYDIFFVFFSEMVFGQNVMVQVATSTPPNPASAFVTFFGLPFSPVPNLAMPAKLIIPNAHNQEVILGLGDLILPEMLLVYLLEFDLLHPTSRLMSGYFSFALVAYATALFLSFYCNFLFRAAQPALLYIVPCLLIPTVVVARRRGQLLALWNGSHKQHSTTPISAAEESLLLPTTCLPSSTVREDHTSPSTI